MNDVKLWLTNWARQKNYARASRPSKQEAAALRIGNSARNCSPSILKAAARKIGYNARNCSPSKLEAAAQMVGNGVPSKQEAAAQKVGNGVQIWEIRLKYAKGDSINLNGKEFVWDNKTRRYGYWRSAKNGKHYFKPMKREEYAQMVAIGVEKFFGSPKMLKKRAPESEIRAEMLQEERRWLVPLYSLGRQILPDIPLTNHVTLIDEHKMPNRADGRCSIDLVKNGLIVQRRFFDSNGNIEQDVDYDHPDSQKNHDKPHIHVWIGKNRSLQIKYRDENGVVKEEFTRMRYKKQFYNDEYDPILAVFAFDRKRRGKNEDYDANLLSFLD